MLIGMNRLVCFGFLLRVVWFGTIRLCIVDMLLIAVVISRRIVIVARGAARLAVLHVVIVVVICSATGIAIRLAIIDGCVHIPRISGITRCSVGRHNVVICCRVGSIAVIIATIVTRPGIIVCRKITNIIITIVGSSIAIPCIHPGLAVIAHWCGSVGIVSRSTVHGSVAIAVVVAIVSIVQPGTRWVTIALCFLAIAYRGVTRIVDRSYLPQWYNPGRSHSGC